MFSIFNKTRNTTITKERKKKITKPSSSKQLILDFGQKLPEVVVCDTCFMNYKPGVKEDNKLHNTFHAEFLAKSDFYYQLKKKEYICKELKDGSIILKIDSQDIQSNKMLTRLMKHINEELGFPPDILKYKPESKLYLNMDHSKLISGLIIAEKCTQAHVINGHTLSSHTVPCKCGINRMWVHKHHRRQGIAKRLLDTVRSTFVFGHYMGTEEIAFSSPTADGQAFASSYTQKPDFLVYGKL